MEGSSRKGTLESVHIFERIILPALVTGLENSREEAGNPSGVLVRVIVVRISLSPTFYSSLQVVPLSSSAHNILVSEPFCFSSFSCACVWAQVWGCTRVNMHVEAQS